MSSVPREPTRLCTKCAQWLPLCSYHADRRRPDGLRPACKTCVREQHRIYESTPEFKEKMRLRSRVVRAADPEAQRVYAKEYRTKNAAAVAEKSRARRKTPEERARHLLRKMVKRGKIVKPANCQECGAQVAILHGHHHDYAQPLNVTWLCVACHTLIHRTPDGQHAHQ